MTLDKAFEIVLELAEDAVSDCAADRDMLTDYNLSLEDMQQALNQVKAFING